MRIDGTHLISRATVTAVVLSVAALGGCQRHHAPDPAHDVDIVTPDLVRAGFHVLTFDQRGFGDTAGGRADEHKALGDAEAAYVYLRSKPDVEKGRMAVGGARRRIQ